MRGYVRHASFDEENENGGGNDLQSCFVKLTYGIMKIMSVCNKAYGLR